MFDLFIFFPLAQELKLTTSRAMDKNIVQLKPLLRLS